MNYTAKNIKSIYKVSHQTVQNWSKTFTEFLSPSARPAAGHMRLFNDDDLSVFQLAHDMTRQGSTYEDVLAALANGSRGVPPEALDPSETALALPPERQVVILRESLATLEKENRQLKDDLSESNGQNKLLKNQLDEIQAKVDRLNREIGKLEG